jgi:phosphate transport system protein
MLAQKIIDLKKRIIDQANIVQNMLAIAFQGINKRDTSVFDELYKLEDTVNQNEIEIDEICTQLIALHQPEAKNLRTILMILKMNNDLERMGDLVVNISKSGKYIISKPEIKKLIDLPRMAEEVAKMLKDSIKAFINEDPDTSREVCKNDDIVDDYKEHIFRVLITYMIEEPTTIKRAFNILMISQNLERIADLATNIAEETIFMTDGKIIKHGNELED